MLSEIKFLTNGKWPAKRAIFLNVSREIQRKKIKNINTCRNAGVEKLVNHKLRYLNHAEQTALFGKFSITKTKHKFYFCHFRNATLIDNDYYPCGKITATPMSHIMQPSTFDKR